MEITSIFNRGFYLGWVNPHFLWVSKTSSSNVDKLVAKADDLSYTYVDKERAAATSISTNFFTFIENYTGLNPKTML